MAVFVRLTDGLGNQMFQYAVGHSLSLRLGTVCRVDRAYFKTVQKRTYQLDYFRGSPTPIQAEDNGKNIPFFQERQPPHHRQQHLQLVGRLAQSGSG